MLRVLKPFGIRKGTLLEAMKTAEKAQEEFSASIKIKGAEIFPSLQERCIIIVGRPYNAFESGMNLNIPKKLADLNVLAIPMDFILLQVSG